MTSILTGEQLVNARIKSERELPVIGLKEFQPSNSWLQNRQIQSALFDRKVLLEEERVEKWGSLSTAVWRSAVGKAEVTRKTGKHWDVFGHHKDNADWLYPEEALFLMEMNCLELLFEDVPMSIQRGYTVLISSETGCSLNEYRVFLHLSRQGYRVFRHNPDLTVTAYEKQIRLDQYVLGQKRRKDCYDTTLQSEEIKKEQSVLEVVVDNIDLGEECDVISEIVKQEVQMIHIDESDDDIIEVVYEKSVKQESEESDKESYSESESDTDSSRSGNWKRQSVSHTSFASPAVRINYVTVNEFLFDVDLVRKNCRPNVNEELKKFYNEIEVIDLGSEPEEDKLIIKKNRRDILDTMRLIKDSEGNVIIARPEEKLLPPGVQPKFPLYRINLDSIRTETQKRMTNAYPRGNRGWNNSNFYRRRYNSYNPWNSRVNNSRSIPNDFRGNSMNQMAQLQTMAHNMMQMASAVLLNTMTQPYQPNWQARYPNQSRSIHPQQFQQNYTNVPLVHDYRQNSKTRSQNNSNFNSPSINYPARNERSILGQHPYESLGNIVQSYRNDYNTAERNFPTGSRNYNDESNDSDRNYSNRRYQPYFQGFNRSNQSPRITEYDENVSSTNTRSETNVKSEPNNQRLSETSIDPAYTCEDIPLSDDFISFSGPMVHNNVNNRVRIVDVNNLNKDDDVVIVEDDVLQNGVKRNGKKRMNPNQRYFFLPTKKFKKQQKQRRNTFRRKFRSHDVEVIDLEGNDSDSSAEEEITSTCIKIEPVATGSLSVKKEKTENTPENISCLLVLSDQIKTESDSISDKIKIENEAVKVSVPIKTEVSDTVTVTQRVLELEKLVSNKVNNTASSLKNQVQMEQSMYVTEVKVEKPEVKDTTSIVVKVEPQTELESHLNVTIATEVEVQTSVENVNIESLIEDHWLEINEGINNETDIEVEVEVGNISNEEEDDETELLEETKKGSEVEVNKNIMNEEKDSEIELHENTNRGEEIEVSNMRNAEKSEEIELHEETDNFNTDCEILMEVDDDAVQRNEIQTQGTSAELDVEQDSLQDNNDACSNEQISNWAELKKTVSTFVRLEREESNVEEEEFEDDVRPLLKPQHCQTIGSVLSALQIFKPASIDVLEEEKLKVMFDMYMPSATFRKSSRGLPAYRIVVVGNASPVPSPGQISELKKRFKDDTTILLAVVMADSIAYYILAPVTLPTQQFNV